MNKVCAFAPATVANLSVGFDVLGLALSTIGDKVEVEVNTQPKHEIVEIISDINLPYEIEKNSCSVVIETIRKQTNSDKYVKIKIKKGFNAGSGLGSSAASSVAAGFAYNNLLGNPLSNEELLLCCAEGERVACGSPILDNIAAALYGGVVFISDKKVYQLPTMSDFHLVAFFQHVTIKTEAARAVLPEKIPLKDAVQQVRKMASFIHALHTKNEDLLQISFQDFIVEPYRKQLIPNFNMLEEISRSLNAFAFGISGSGPTVFTLVKSEEVATQIAKQFYNLATQQGLTSTYIIEKLGNKQQGAYLCTYND